MISAKEARELTKTQIDNVLIKPYLDMLEDLIEAKAKDGINHLYHPFHFCQKFQYPNDELQKAIFIHLISLGYEIIHHLDPDPGHPCSSPYDEIRW